MTSDTCVNDSGPVPVKWNERELLESMKITLLKCSTHYPVKWNFDTQLNPQKEISYNCIAYYSLLWTHVLATWCNVVNFWRKYTGKPFTYTNSKSTVYVFGRKTTRMRLQSLGIRTNPVWALLIALNPVYTALIKFLSIPNIRFF